jgi:FkbM family methyltransferase
MVNFIGEIEAALSKQASNSELVKLFFSGEENVKRYVIGKNEQSLELINKVKIEALIDDYAAPGASWNGVKTVKSNAVEKDALIVNCSSSIYPVSVNGMLQRAGLKSVLNLHELLKFPNGIDAPWFVSEMHEEFQKNSQFWEDLFNRLEDEDSKNTLLNVLRYRLTANPEYMDEYSVRLNDQYFEPFMQYTNEIFVDAGGFDGDSTEEFCKRYPDYKKVLFFEPSGKNMLAAKNRLKGFANIEYFQLGISDEVAELSFNPDGGSASKVTDTGVEKINVAPLDQLVNDGVTFIKMDLEGWEMNALHGSEKHICNDKPKLAIAVYHRASDFRTIPQYILSLNPEYKLFLRHYTEGWSETVMFFLPK